MTKAHERMAVFVFGVVFVIVMLSIAMLVPNPSGTQYETFKIVLALAVAGIAAFIPGFMEVTVPKVLRAGGALAVFWLIYANTPARMVATPTRPPQILWHARGTVLEDRKGQAAVPVAGADIRVDEDPNARATSRQDGTFELDVHGWPDGHVMFRVTAPGRPEFTALEPVGTGDIELTEKRSQ
jgi:hypothetical protein